MNRTTSLQKSYLDTALKVDKLQWKISSSLNRYVTYLLILLYVNKILWYRDPRGGLNTSFLIEDERREGGSGMILGEQNHIRIVDWLATIVELTSHILYILYTGLHKKTFKDYRFFKPIFEWTKKKFKGIVIKLTF